jgi:hypothetical protein
MNEDNLKIKVEGFSRMPTLYSWVGDMHNILQPQSANKHYSLPQVLDTNNLSAQRLDFREVYAEANGSKKDIHRVLEKIDFETGEIIIT